MGSKESVSTQNPMQKSLTLKKLIGGRGLNND